MEIQVTNLNSFAVVGRYDSRDYAFYPNIPTKLPEDAANHIFAIGKDRDKTGAMNRLGLFRSGVSHDQALHAFRQFKFETGRVVFETPQPQPQPDKPDDEKPEDEDNEIGANTQRAPRVMAPGRDTEAEGTTPSLSASADLKPKPKATYRPNSPDRDALVKAARGG
jgi:hypothetical protein